MLIFAFYNIKLYNFDTLGILLPINKNNYVKFCKIFFVVFNLFKMIYGI